MLTRPPPATHLLQARGRSGARLQGGAAVAAVAHLAHSLQRNCGRHRAPAQLRVAHRRHVIVVHALRAPPPPHCLRHDRHPALSLLQERAQYSP
jgi:hypothetical protein